MNYYEKYLKYKNKYLNLKKSNMMEGGFFEITTESNLAGLTEMRNILATSESNDNFSNTDKGNINELVKKLKTVICDPKTDSKSTTGPNKEPTTVPEPTPEPNMEPVAEPTPEPNMEPVAEPNMEPVAEPTPAPEPTTDTSSNSVMEGGFLLRGLLTESSLDLSSSDTISSTEI